MLSKLLCSVFNVNLTSDLMSAVTLERTRQSYLCVQLAIIAFDGWYIKAADRLDDNFPVYPIYPLVDHFPNLD